VALRRTQLESHDDGGARGHVSGVYAFSADPRGGGRAYYVDDGTLLWQTQDSGATWSLIPTPAPDSGCGGIPNVHAVQPPVSLTQFKLYYGNRCTTYVVTVTAGATITVTYAEPNGTIVDQTTTDAQGSFTDMTTAVSSGTWSVSAGYGGSAAFAGSSSAPCTTALS
jgi:hypothetical protein